MQITITGGAGFIGSHLTPFLLEKGFDITVVDNLKTGKREHLPEGVKFINADAYHIPEKSDIIIHLAAEATARCSSTCWKNNVTDSVKLFKKTKKIKAKIIFTSSAAVYGECKNCKEREPTPKNLYGATKAIGELLLKEMNIPHITLRLFNVYGERMNPAYGSVIYNFTKNMLNKKSPIIYGDGKQKRDFIYVGDVVKAIYKSIELLEKTNDETINIATGKPTEIIELFKKMKEILNFKGNPIYKEKRDEEIYESWANVEKMKKLLKIEPLPLEKGLKKTIEFYKTQP